MACDPFKLGVGRGDLGDLGVLRSDGGGLEGVGDGLEVFGVGENFPVFAFVGEIFGTGIENDLGQLLFAGGGLGDGDDALGGEHPGDGTVGTEVAAVLGKGVADFADGAILVVGEDIDDDGDASGAVALVGDLLVGDAFELAGAALNGALDVFRRACSRLWLRAMAPRRRGFPSGSPPPSLAAMVISLIRRVKIFPRLASRAPFLCLIVAHFEWPDMYNLRVDLLRLQVCRVLAT